MPTPSIVIYLEQVHLVQTTCTHRSKACCTWSSAASVLAMVNASFVPTSSIRTLPFHSISHCSNAVSFISYLRNRIVFLYLYSAAHGRDHSVALPVRRSRE